MRNLQLVLLLLSSGLALGTGCSDDTGTGGSGANSGGNPGNGAGQPDGGNGAGQSNGGNGGDGGGTGGTGGVGGMGPGYSCEVAAAAPPTLALEEVETGLGGLLQAKSPPGFPDRLFLVLQGGQIQILDNGEPVGGDFLDLDSSVIQAGGEEGLLGLAFHPDYATNGRFFVHYSAAGGGDSTVMEYAVSADPLVADPTPVQLVFQHGTAQGNHNGGAVEFGNDGFLYISLGDGGAQSDPGCDALDLGTMLGKIVRLDVDQPAGANGYPAAAGNPDGGALYYHIGFRNPWRMSFDQCNGDLYIGDVGQGTREEIDLAQQADGALNFGWPLREGFIAHSGYDGSCANEPPAPEEPIADYSHGSPENGCSVSGGYVYRGSVTPNIRGWYFYGDFCTGAVYMLRASAGAIMDAPVDTGLTVDNISAFGLDGNGEVYACDLGGTLYHIVAR